MRETWDRFLFECYHGLETENIYSRIAALEHYYFLWFSTLFRCVLWWYKHFISIRKSENSNSTNMQVFSSVFVPASLLHMYLYSYVFLNQYPTYWYLRVLPELENYVSQRIYHALAFLCFLISYKAGVSHNIFQYR